MDTMSLENPYVPITLRDPMTGHVTVTFVGGGFSGLVTGVRLVKTNRDGEFTSQKII
jgi:hypothetical protein